MISIVNIGIFAIVILVGFLVAECVLLMLEKIFDMYDDWKDKRNDKSNSKDNNS